MYNGNVKSGGILPDLPHTRTNRKTISFFHKHNRYFSIGKNKTLKGFSKIKSCLAKAKIPALLNPCAKRMATETHRKKNE